MRPLIVAEPIFRAPSPEIESESYFTPCARRYGAKNVALVMHAVSTKQRVTLSISMMSLKVILQSALTQKFGKENFSASLRVWFRFCFSDRHREQRIVQWDVKFYFVHRKFRALLASLLSAFEGKRKIQPVHLFIVSIEVFCKYHRPANSTLILHFDFEEGVGVQKVIAHIAIF